MVLEFILPFGRLILAALTPEKRQKVMKKTGLMHTRAVEVFKYGKNNNDYWDGAKLYQQVVNKTLSIAKILYPSYWFLFFFDNAISYSIYAKNVF